MLHASEAITVIHHVRESDKDTYTCRTFSGSWYEQLRTAVTTGGLQSARTVRVRIPAEQSSGSTLLDFISPGDRMLRGIMASCTSAEFAALGRNHQAAAVLAVHDNTRAIPPHIYLEGVS